MITKEKIQIYKKYHGDVDSYARASRKRERAIMDDDDFYKICAFEQDLILIRNGLAAGSYVNSVNQRLLENCDNEETIQQIKDLAAGKETPPEAN